MQRRTVTLVEGYAHHQHLYTEILLYKQWAYNIRIITVTGIVEALQAMDDGLLDDVEIVAFASAEGRNFWRAVSNYSNKSDLLVLNTLLGNTRRYLYFGQVKSACKMILIDANHGDWFIPEAGRYCPEKLPLWKRVITKWGIARILHQTDGILAHSPEIVKLVQGHISVPVYFVPFVIYSGDATATDELHDDVNFCVSGTIEERRKDYIGLLEAFETVFETYGEKVSLTLLGSSREKDRYVMSVYEKAARLKRRGFNITYFESRIPEEEYRNHVRRANFSVCPINREAYLRGIPNSGELDAILHAKPGIYPAWYSIYPELEESSLRYEHISELPVVVGNAIAQQKDLKCRAIYNAEKLSLGSISEKILPLINGFI